MTPGHSTNTKKLNSTARLGAYTAIGGAVTMIVGAALWGASGTDLWMALDKGEMASYLTVAGAVKPQLVANLSFWIIGVLILGLAGTILSDLGRQRWALAQAALLAYRTAVPLAIIAFITMLSIVVQIAPDTSETAISIAKVVGWVGARADDLATALLIGIGPLLISLAGRGNWTPNWLARWGYLAGIVGLFSLIIPYFPSLAPFNFLIVIVGMSWMIAAGIVLLRLKPVD